MGKAKRLAACLLLAILSLLAGFLIGRRSVDKNNGDMGSEVKYVVRTDTLRVSEPLPYEVRVTDTMLVTVTDTVRVRDTLYVRLPRESKVYEQDSLYRAVVSGYEPSLDSLTIYEKTITITKPATMPSKSRWSVGFGPTIGAGWVSSFGGHSGLGIFAGAGFSVTYNF